jgi:hypothetical protein
MIFACKFISRKKKTIKRKRILDLLPRKIYNIIFSYLFNIQGIAIFTIFTISMYI